MGFINTLHFRKYKLFAQFVQERIGKNGRKFKFYKFRSMVPNADQMLDSLLEKNEMEGPAFKMKDDPRLQALNRCFRRIDQDVSRGIITDDERRILKKKAKHLHRQSFLRSGTTYEELDEMLQSDNLYPLCGVIRMSNPVGRPRKKKAARKK